MKEGTFLYDREVECDIRIVFSPVQFGTGDAADPEDIREDISRESYYLEFGSTTQRGVFNAGGGWCDSLEEAEQAAMKASGIEGSIRWNRQPTST